MWNNRESFSRVSTYLTALLRCIDWESSDTAQTEQLLEMLRESANKTLAGDCDKFNLKSLEGKQMMVSRQAFTSLSPRDALRMLLMKINHAQVTSIACSVPNRC